MPTEVVFTFNMDKLKVEIERLQAENKRMQEETEAGDAEAKAREDARKAEAQAIRRLKLGRGKRQGMQKGKRGEALPNDGSTDASKDATNNARFPILFDLDLLTQS